MKMIWFIILFPAIIFRAWGYVRLDIPDLPSGLLAEWPSDLSGDSINILLKLHEKMDSLGYFQNKLEVKRQGDSLMVYGRTGQRHILETVIFRGNQAFAPDILLFHSGIKKGSYFDASKLSKGIDNILELYEDHGYPFCRIMIEKITPAKGKVTVSIVMDEGRLYYVGNIRIEGNTVTRSYVIQRELSVQKGDTFRQASIEESIRRLERVNYFETVSDPQILVHSRKRWIDLLFRIEEGKTIFAEGVLGYQPEEGTGRNPWIGSGNIEARNILGTGRHGAVNFQLEPGYKFFVLNYLEPWIAKQHMDGSVSLSLEMDENIFSRLITDLLLKYYLNYQWALSMQFENSELNDLVQKFLCRSYGAGTGIEWNAFDRPENPTQGIYFQSEVLVHRKEKEASIYKEWSAKNRGEFAYPLKRKFVLFLGLSSENIQSPQPFLSWGERLRLGGSGSIRGYREGQFAVEQALWGTFEIRFLPERLSRLYLFTDGGIGIWREENGNNKIEEKQQRLLGYGAGLRMPTRLGILGIDFAINRESTFREAKIHVRLKAVL